MGRVPTRLMRVPARSTTPRHVVYDGTLKGRQPGKNSKSQTRILCGRQTVNVLPVGLVVLCRGCLSSSFHLSACLFVVVRCDSTARTGTDKESTPMFVLDCVLGAPAALHSWPVDL